jgi:Kef-type K+ transport system membrane component KefB
MNSNVIILGAAVIVILSFFANILSKKTNVPSVLMLMLIGLGMQLVTDIHQDTLLPYLEILGTVGVILIVLEAALDLKLEENKWSLIWRASTLALLGLVATSGLSAFVLWGVLGLSPLVAMLYAVPLAVLSSAIIIPSVGKLKSYPKEFLIFESALSDILGIILFYALIDFHYAGATPDVAAVVGGKLLLTLVLSVVISYGMIVWFQSMTDSVRLFMLIAVLMGLYAAGKLLHLSPLILILVFGLTLNNKDLFFRGGMLKFVNDAQFDNILKDLRFIVLETAFVVRTFFFVAFGMSIILDSLLHWTVPVVGTLVLLITYGTRFLGLRAFSPDILEPAIYVAPRGLITVLLFYAIPDELLSDRFQLGIILTVVLVSSFVMTYGLIQEQRNVQRARAEKAEKKASNQNGEKKASLPAEIPPLETVASSSTRSAIDES